MEPRFSSVKLSAQLVDEARREAELCTRSIAVQVEHWAKLGRAVERAQGGTIDRVKAAVDGRVDPAELSITERAYYYDLLDAAIAEASAAEADAIAKAGTVPGAAGYDGETIFVVDSAGIVRGVAHE